MRLVACAGLLLLLVAPPGHSQVADSAARLPDRTVTVTRGGDSLHRLGAPVSVVEGAGVTRGRVSGGLDEALAFVPGVIVGNRWNYSLDQRLSIRGFGARANFGLRGVKVLLDGVPQTLPDGQSQLTNVDLSLVDRIEVLRGAASALQGNAAGGVIAFTTRVVPRNPLEVRIATEHGTFGTSRTQVVGAARHGNVGGTVAVSRFVTDGSRLHSRAEQRRMSMALDWAVAPGVTVIVRGAAADDPIAENPGALTAAELAARRDTAAATNILRGADKAVTQQQFAIGIRADASRIRWDISAFGLRRNLDNPLAAPPPQPASAAEGTWVGIDRAVYGLRATASAALSDGPRAARLMAGIDAQSMRDDRENRRALGGVPGTDVLVAQREHVREVGPFVQLTAPLGGKLEGRVGLRYDRMRFAVRDRRPADGDASGSRTMAAASGHAALTLTPSPTVTTWGSVSTSFETPTTTELANRVEGDGGFNSSLDPQRSVSFEAGMRWRTMPLRGEVAAYHTATRDALIAFRENAGRTYFRNAGRTRTSGIEASITAPLTQALAVMATWTHTRAVFGRYHIVEGDVVTSFDGNRLPGIPPHVGRIGLRGAIGAGLTIDVDHAWSSSMFADDRNNIEVDGWGMGVSGMRVQWSGVVRRYHLAPFVAVTNAFDREHVGSVTINGGFGRVFEPAAGRAVYVGVTVGAEAR